MARNGGADSMTIKEIAEKEHFSPDYIEKIFQILRASDIVVSRLGKQGGFSLSRPPSQITMKEIIEALEGQTFDVFCEPEVREHIVCTHFCMCGVRPVWAKTKALLDNFYGSITLEMIAKEEGIAKTLIPVGNPVSPSGARENFEVTEGGKVK
jgi:Rrf2 family protein